MNLLEQVKENNLMIGVDPEFAFWSPLPGINSRIPAYRVIGNGGPDRQSVLETRFGTDAHSETAELRVLPANDPVQLTKNIGSVITGYIRHKRFKPAYYLDWYADNRVEHVGGHIHFGHPTLVDYESSTQKLQAVRRLASNLDILLSVPVMMIENSESARRRKQGRYGGFGDIRQQPHGFEYRTPPSFLASPQLTESVLCLAYAIAYDVMFKGYHSKLVGVLEDDFQAIGNAFKGHVSTLFSFMLPKIHSEVRKLTLYPVWEKQIEFLFANAQKHTSLTEIEIKRSWGAKTLDYSEFLPEPKRIFECYSDNLGKFKPGETLYIDRPVFRIGGKGRNRDMLFAALNKAIMTNCEDVNVKIGYPITWIEDFVWDDRTAPTPEVAVPARQYIAATQLYRDYNSSDNTHEVAPVLDRPIPYVGNAALEILFSSSENAYLQVLHGANSFWEFVRDGKTNRAYADYIREILKTIGIQASDKPLRMTSDKGRTQAHRLVLPNSAIENEPLVTGLAILGISLPLYSFTKDTSVETISAWEGIAKEIAGRIGSVKKIAASLDKVKKPKEAGVVDLMKNWIFNNLMEILNLPNTLPVSADGRVLGEIMISLVNANQGYRMAGYQVTLRSPLGNAGVTNEIRELQARVNQLVTSVRMILSDGPDGFYGPVVDDMDVEFVVENNEEVAQLKDVLQESRVLALVDGGISNLKSAIRLAARRNGNPVVAEIRPNNAYPEIGLRRSFRLRRARPGVTPE